MILYMILGCTPSIKETAAPEQRDTQEEVEVSAFEVTGTVLDPEGAGVPQAMVLVGGQYDTLTYTDENGWFSLWFEDNGHGEPAIVASKEGYRARGYEFFKPDTPITVTIIPIADPDNTEYEFQDPGDGFDSMEENCSHCHTDFVQDFLTSSHAEATNNPLLQDLYAGVTKKYNTEAECEENGGSWKMGIEPGTTNRIEKCYLDEGVLPDLNPNCAQEQEACDDPEISQELAPDAFGGCADCHAPGINGELGDRNLHDAMGLAYEVGVHCDTCHKVRDVDESQPAGFGKRLVVHRPSEPGRNTFLWDPVYYGPIPDVPNIAMSASPQPKFNESVFCSGCHEQLQEALLPEQSLDAQKWPGGIPIHSTYSEWQEGPYNQDKTQCQWCHMPSYMDRANAVDIATVENQSITFGFPREPEDIRQHIFRGPLQGEPRLIDTAVHLSLSSERNGNTLSVTASLSNIGCGHAIPTGEPMRSLLLVVEAGGSCGDLMASGGMTIPDTGGHIATGIIGAEVDVVGTQLSWSQAQQSMEEGEVLRIVRPTGIYEDYEGIGTFGGEQRTPQEKGMERMLPVGQAQIISVDEGQIHLSNTVDVQQGDIVYLGESLHEGTFEGQASLSIAGHAGYAFSKVLVDAQGNRHVPHYRAIDIASDNRIAPGSNVRTHHEFTIPQGCDSGQIEAQLLYRPIPISLALPRGWDAKDHVIATSQISW